MATKQQRHFTTYVRVQKWKALQIEVHPMSAENSRLPWWFEDRHLQEVLQLLRGPIFERVKLKRREIGKNMSKSAIATGPTVRIGYVFRPKPEYQMCLLPTSQPLYTSDSEDETSAPTYQYRNLSLHHEKLIVYSCLLKETSVHSSMAQIMSVIGENSPLPKTVSISSYFSRVVPPGTASQSSQTSSCTTDGPSNTRSSSPSKEEVTAPPSDTCKRKLKCIIKRSGPKLSKKAKKMKTSIEYITSNPVASRCSRNMDDVKENVKNDDDEFSRLSFYGDLPQTQCLLSNDERKSGTSYTEDENDAGELCTNSNPDSEKLAEVKCYKKCRMKSELEKCVETDSGRQSCSSKNLISQFHERDEMMETSDEINFVEVSNKDTAREKVNSAKGSSTASTSHKSKPVSKEATSDNIDLAGSDTSELSLYMVETPSPPHSCKGTETAGTSVTPPVKSLTEKEHSTVLSDTIASTSFSHQSKPPPSNTSRTLRDRNRDENFIETGKSEKEGRSKKNDCEIQGHHIAADDPNSDELPKIVLKKRDRSWRKSLAMMISKRSPEKLEEEAIDCDKIHCDLMEDLEELPKHKMYLTDDFRKELKGITHESELTESHIEKMVLGSKDYLHSIFMGKHHCRRHADYKKGGTARFNLNYQVNLGMFTEAQQDAVMETLMTIFCKRHHKYMDYILKVLLPEMLIWILMKIKHTSYEETEKLMSGVIM